MRRELQFAQCARAKARATISGKYAVRAIRVLPVLFASLTAGVYACPGCREAAGDAKLSFNWSIYFLLVVILSLVGAAMVFLQRIIKKEQAKAALDAENLHIQQSYWKTVTLPVCLAMIVVLMFMGSGEGDASASSAYVPEKTIREKLKTATFDTLVVFKSDRCSVCAQMTPVLENAQSAYGSRIKFIYADAYKAKGLARELNVDHLPCAVLFRGGKELSRREGLQPESEYQSWLFEAGK
ncbi:MAG TPA: thioredoxin family protein [Planctomycetota bacterium]|nr:thioredoxin family protein [Planctomycetota bacterium]